MDNVGQDSPPVAERGQPAPLWEVLGNSERLQLWQALTDAIDELGDMMRGGDDHPTRICRGYYQRLSDLRKKLTDARSLF